MVKSISTKFSIGVQGVKIIADYLDRNLSIPADVSFFQKQDKKFFNFAKNADVLVAMSWGKSMWGGVEKVKVPETNNLKLLHIPGAGVDGINFKFLPKKCKLCNVYEHEITIAEYCVANILNWQTNMIKISNNFKKLNWNDSLIFSGPAHSELHNKTIGIYGYGRIGKELARRLKPFNVKIIGFTRVKRRKDNYINQTELSKNLKKVVNGLDFLVMACPLTAETHNVIDRKIFSNMKKEAVIINIARGGVIKEKDLFDALKSNSIGGAIIDTWFNYPKTKKEKDLKPSKYNFHKLENVIMTPHISAWSIDMITRRANLINKNIEKLFHNKKLINQIRY